jgi:hypothetical protein
MIVTSPATNITGTQTVTATCTGTKKVLGGGATNSNSVNFQTAQSWPASNSSWSVTFAKTSGNAAANANVAAYALCANTN